MIESRGTATVAVGLVRPHMEKSRVPRGLWVPFPLGRPFGEPEDKGFQRRVLLTALGLLGRRDTPGLIVDFPDDAPSMRDRAGWTPQIAVPARRTATPIDPQDWIALLDAEFAAVRPHWEVARRRFGRTTVGNSRMLPEQWGPYAAGFLAGEIPESPTAGVSASVVLRYVADDMKAFYAEAVQAIGQQPSSEQVNRWFWYETAAADFLRAVRLAALASQHNGFKTAGSRFVVPVPWVSPS